MFGYSVLIQTISVKLNINDTKNTCIRSYVILNINVRMMNIEHSRRISHIMVYIQNIQTYRATHLNGQFRFIAYSKM